MSIKSMNCQVLAVGDMGLLKVVDEHGATFSLQPEPEDVARSMAWSTGNVVRFKKLSITAAFPWRGTRKTSNAVESRHDRAFFRVVPSVEE